MSNISVNGNKNNVRGDTKNTRITISIGLIVIIGMIIL